MTGLEAIGVGSSDFNNNEWTDFGTSGTLVSRSATEDFRGSKTFTSTGTSAVTIVFHRRERTYIRDKEGVRELAPAYIMHKTDSGIKRGDMIIIKNGTWKVHNVLNRDDIYSFSDLYLWD